MLRKILSCRLLCTVGVLALAGAVAVAAPLVIGKGRKITGTLQSLAGVKRVQLFISPLHPALKAAGVSENKIRKVWREPLESAGIQIVTGRGVPSIILSIDYFSEREIPDAVALLGSLRFDQQVHINRINKDVRVPTYSMNAHMLVSREAVGRAFGLLVNAMVNDFIGSVKDMADLSTPGDES